MKKKIILTLVIVFMFPIYFVSAQTLDEYKQQLASPAPVEMNVLFWKPETRTNLSLDDLNLLYSKFCNDKSITLQKSQGDMMRATGHNDAGAQLDAAYIVYAEKCNTLLGEINNKPAIIQSVIEQKVSIKTESVKPSIATSVQTKIITPSIKEKKVIVASTTNNIPITPVVKISFWTRFKNLFKKLF